MVYVNTKADFLKYSMTIDFFEDCRSLQNNRCLFPFVYKNVIYKECTDVDSIEFWCATEVDSSGLVVNNKWEDCQSNCPNNGK